MKKLKLFLHLAGLITILILFQQCSKELAVSKYTPETAPANKHLLMAVLYHQAASEYRALCYQSFNYARLLVDNDLRRMGLSLKQAIVLDIDETVLDNSPYEAQLILKDILYPEQWAGWISTSSAEAIPGALDFVKYAAEKGMDIYYITNRKESEKQATINNLKKLDFPFADTDHVLTRQESSSKKDRRETVAANHRIVLLIGDNLNDFTEIFENKTVSERFELTDSLREEFGRQFIMLPNVMYGDWEGALYEYNYKLSQEQKKEKLSGYLKGF